MFKQKEKWTIYAAVFLGLLVSGFLVLRQIQYSYHFKIMNLRAGSNISSAYQHIFMLNEEMTKNFFLIFFCFWLMLFGSVIYFTHSERFYNSDYIHDRRFLLRSILPGISMIIIGALILAFSLWKFTDIKRNMLAQDTKLNASVAFDKIAEQADTAIHESRLTANLFETKKDGLIHPATANHTLAHTREKKIPPKQKNALQPTAAINAGNNNEAQKKETGIITPEETQWTNTVATNTIKYGYYPTRADKKRLKNTLAAVAKDENGEPKNNKLWSLCLVQKMQDGYQPTDAEMRRYEHIAEEVAN